MKDDKEIKDDLASEFSGGDGFFALLLFMLLFNPDFSKKELEIEIDRLSNKVAKLEGEVQIIEKIIT